MTWMKQHFGCEVKYWGTGKNRFQLEVPANKQTKAGDEYDLASGTKTVKRDRSPPRIRETKL